MVLLVENRCCALLIPACALLLALAGCGDDASAEGGWAPSTEGGDGDGDPGEGATAEQGDGDGDPQSGDGDPNPGDGDGDPGDGDGDPTGGPKFDTLVPGDGGGGSPNCIGGNICDDAEFSYVWISNSSQNSVTKLNTRTMVEEGRYWTRPDQGGSPSRTSVSVDGRAVAIANREVGITKIWADLDDCEDKNNNGVIDTSTGANDIRAFAQDECIAWHTTFPDMSVQRPVAWTSGTYNEATCEWENQKIWTMTGSDGTPGQCGTTGIWVHRLNGDTGEIEDTVHIPHADAPCTIGNIDWGLGPYGAAVDNENNVWFYIWGQSKIVKIDYDTLAYQVYQGGSYGITVDSEGRPWDDAPRRFDPDTQTWQQPIGNLPGSGGSGVAQDLQGRIWKATTGGVGWVDMETMMVGDTVLLPEGNVIYRGIAVDVDGFIWAIALGGTTAHKIDPDTYAITTFDGLSSPYTYSDMAGGQLSNVTCNEPQG
jgi:streptogramin lyase